jgi:UDP-N-acetylglucosamine acyltransferase
MTPIIHPTAVIEKNVILGNNVTIEAFAVIKSKVTIGDDCNIGAHAVIQPFVKLGTHNHVHPHVVLGGLPQDINFQATTLSGLVIGHHNVFREGFTAHRATVENGNTVIGSNNYFMNNSHVAHDCTIGDHTIFANNVAIGGLVEIGDYVFMGGAVVVHQFCRIGSYAMVQGTTGLNKDVIPFMLIAGYPAKHYRLNTLGLKRAKITGENYKVLASAFRLLRNKQSLDPLQTTKELVYLKKWLAIKSTRGTHGFVSLDKH